MTKRAQLKELRRVLSESDIVVEVLDARDPLGCRSDYVSSLVAKAGKHMVVVLSNADLVKNVEKWKVYLAEAYKGAPVIALP